ncbi:response regulator transcription factor [Staphylococcus aureus]|uniref:response regulator transcription factor n=1 Tax=Staphylococcus aureus TaxID=1280 RepID=UPI0021C27A9C|nr:response regulator transcription factor [Staphylococcus aureus]
MSQKVLVVDDEHSIVTLLKYNLETAGYEVVVAFDGDEALEKVESEQPDLIILDVMLPKKDGIDVCKTVRTNKNLVPILMLTAKNDEFDRVLGLELGADDYMTKPFSPREVVARVKAITREHMLNTVWNYEFAGDSRIVDVHISHLRDKLEDNPKKPQLIKTVRGLGYKLERPKEQ